MSNKLPEIEELNKTAKVLKAKRLLYITNFADVLNRYAEIRVKNPLRFTALSLLIRRGGSLTPTQLAASMFRSKHSITKIIDGLEKIGFIIRVRDKKDRRIVHVQLTEQGFQHIKKRMKLGEDFVLGITSTLNDDEWQNLLNYTKRLKKTLAEKIEGMKWGRV